MDHIDRQLQTAWHAMLERIHRDPDERARRIARAARVRNRPIRPWCIAVRAGDTRLADWGLTHSVDINDNAQQGRPHRIELTQADLVDLAAPISLGEWPGVPISEAAKRLGRSHSTIWHWAKTGALDVYHQDRRIWNQHVGGPMAIVWSRSLIDPNAEQGRPPHPVWGCLWQDLAREIPKAWKCTLHRTPHPSGPTCGKGGPNWRWICPGLRHRATEVADDDPSSLTLAQTTSALATPSGDLGALPCAPEQPDQPHLRRQPCNRLARTLYLPLPCFTIADFRGEAQALGIPTPPWAGPNLINQPLACQRCWNIQSRRFSSSEAWNQFVSHITGGLLQGHEVPRPTHAAPLIAKRCTQKDPWRRTHVDRRRAQVRQMLLEGHTAKHIAAHLGVSWETITQDSMAIYRAAGIPPGQGSRWTLAAKLDWRGAGEVDVAANLNLTGPHAHLAQRLASGHTNRQIAEELGISHTAATARIHRLYQKLGITGRAQLRAKAGLTVTAEAGAERTPTHMRIAEAG